MVFIIAALHALFPIIGAWLFGEKGWLYGIGIGCICALIFGALVFTVPDLIGVGVGVVIGSQIITKNSKTKRPLTQEEIKRREQQKIARQKQREKEKQEFKNDLKIQFYLLIAGAIFLIIYHNI